MFRAVFCFALLTVLASPAFAQGWDEGVAALVPVDAFERPRTEVWTDMRPVWSVASEDELVAVRGNALYAGPAPGTATVDAWRARVGRSAAVDCTDARTVCAVLVIGQRGRRGLVLPFGAAPLRVPPATQFQTVDRLRLNAAQAEVVKAGAPQGLLVLGDGNTLQSGSNTVRLVTTQPGAACGARGVRCGVVFEVDTSVGLRLL